MPSYYAHFHVLPIVVAIFVVITPTLGFILAVGLGHIATLFPYLLDAATENPDRYIYAQIMFITIFMYIMTMFVRYMQVNYVYTKYTVPESTRSINVACLVTGILALIGICVSYNFTEKDFPIPHHIGAIMGITFLNVNCHLNTVLTCRTAKKLGYQFWMKWLRILLSYILVLDYILLISCRLYAIMEFDGNYSDRLKWSPNNTGWIPHVVSVVCEWTMILVFGIYLLTFTNEFSDIIISEPIVIFKK